ncbi:hypothetical protein OJ997_00850 [Solirubrobacter phytolaccae]|uniref:Uncharacterized protein n=1 Tax=Solirubrobacter phytolaccae TaxID=1404360 RepID=A0A9X3N9Y1_9ACTN|nr:hypothetical protein [Solirubrobacter phytolaccae]MDA0178827.1 hypothetical protein [Solirubrobacter phytolaccae]
MNESMLRAAFEPARTLEPTAAELARALRPRRRRRWPVFLGVAAAIAVTGTAATAVEPFRGALESLLSSDAGRPAPDAPDWLREKGTRVLAENDGAKLFVRREGDIVHVSLDSSFGQSGPVEDWAKQLGDRRLIVLGPSAPRANDTQRPLFGLTARGITRVELTYARGSSTFTSSATGGFALIVDLRRALGELIGYDAAGAVIERKDMRPVDLRICREVRGCPPGKLAPERDG